MSVSSRHIGTPMPSKDLFGSLIGHQLLLTEKREVTIYASGDSIQDVSNRVFQKLRKQIFEEVKKPIIRLEAEEVYFEDVACTEKTERFLFIFWPRTRRSYQVTAKVVVTIDYLDLKEGEQ